MGMLAPVIGILQVGEQAYADRYTYLPEIGLCLAGTWAAADWAGRWRNRRAALAGAASACLCTLLIAAWRQTAYWSDSVTLMTHTLACTRDNFIAHTDLGSALLDEGRVEGAIAEYREAALINPGDEEVHYNLGDALLGQGRTQEAIAEFSQTIRIDPAYGEAHKNLAEALRRQGRIPEAIAEAQIALGLEPADIGAENNLALMLATAPQASLRDGPRALRLATEAAQASGGSNPVILHTLAAAYAATGQFSKAAETAQKALQLAGAQSNAALAVTLLGEIKLYQAGRLPQEPH